MLAHPSCVLRTGPALMPAQSQRIGEGTNSVSSCDVTLMAVIHQAVSMCQAGSLYLIL